MAKIQREVRFRFLSAKSIIMKDGDEIRAIRIEGISGRSKTEQILELARSGTLRFYVDDIVFSAADASKDDVLPPSSLLLSALLPLSKSEDVIANLNEIFREKWIRRHGIRSARSIWRLQAALIVVQHWLAPIAVLFDRIKAAKLGQ
jgi:hypothetical protein